MPIYNDPTLTYDEIDWVYDGGELRTDATLVIAGRDATDELDEDVKIRVAAHGNSLGTLDAKLDDPAELPEVEDHVAYYIGTDQLYRGRVRTVDVDDSRVDRSLEVDIGCQDEGPTGSLPDPAPFAIVDSTPGAGEVEYVSLKRSVRTTEGGAPKVTYTMVLEADGLRPGMNVEVTSAAFGLSATELEVSEVELSRRYADDPHYVITLGEPAVHLAQVVKEVAAVGPGEITETEIADGAISTPKLAALAVTAEKIQANAITASAIEASAIGATHISAAAVESDKIAAGAVTSDKFSTTAEAPEVRNSTSEVVIEPAGITVTNGKITVTNPGATVIIDGSSNMFKIAATGSQSLAWPGAGFPANASTTTTLSGLGTFSTSPAVHFNITLDNAAAGNPRMQAIGMVTAGSAYVAHAFGTIHLNGSNQAVVAIRCFATGGIGTTISSRYYVLVEAGI